MYTKLLAAAVVLAAGFALASLFPKGDGDAPHPDTSPVDAGLQRSRGARDKRLADQDATARATDSSIPHVQRLANWPDAVASTRSERPIVDREPPPMPAEYAALASDVDNGPAQGESPPQHHLQAAASDRRARKTTHLVVDGDTLAHLAARYLGDATLADRIREMNGGLISDPLPIGMEIEIPSRAEVLAAQHSAARFPGAQTRLVPVAPPQVMAGTDRVRQIGE